MDHPISVTEYVRLQKAGKASAARLEALAEQLGWTSLRARSASLNAVLMEDPYEVAITGRSRAGKSTLLNALIGKLLAPSQRVLTTAVAMLVGPGTVERATVKYHSKPPVHLDGPLTPEVLAPYADQSNNPENAKGVSEIAVELPNDFLALGVRYVDIPGYDDGTHAVWASADAVLKRAHALVLVLDVSPFKDGGFTVDKDTLARRQLPLPLATITLPHRVDRLTAFTSSS